MHGLRPRTPGFLKLPWLAHRHACVCPPLRALIMSGVIWCDTSHAGLVKQVSQSLPAFNYFIWHLPSIKWMGMAISTQHVVNACQRRPRWRGTSHKRTTRKTKHFIKVNGWMRSDAFKRRLTFSFTVIILAQNNFLLLLKPFITMALKYKAILKL